MTQRFHQKCKKGKNKTFDNFNYILFNFTIIIFMIKIIILPPVFPQPSLIVALHASFLAV
jgi:hypothetical protein